MKQFLSARELAALLGVSESASYKYIRTMNDELQEKGYLICRGKISAAYVQQRFFGLEAEKGAVRGE
ncbi:Uncharacterised protein [uncultured Roseburia sp.]|uniref:Helix-turn-helix domain-containing protein n=1 Tax=Brotonthovivens ammoniilytica TaxID=2981725 RepID=A0ABT2TIY5_9FIRM|nr:helix-turn-helix domain-containing protein [Brotonthovivens ammoniilytica]MCU6762175.1 helix-turn-helix domain-containing protein [Brotonthovivens ammoniilytica]SCI57854.1 Uncharacterised protein [uncultured Roseburia sp.]